MRDTISLTRRMVESRLSYNGELDEALYQVLFISSGKKNIPKIVSIVLANRYF